MILRIRIFVNRKILILRIFLRKMTILRKILRIRLILRIRIFVNTGPDLHALNNFSSLIVKVSLKQEESARERALCQLTECF